MPTERRPAFALRTLGAASRRSARAPCSTGGCSIDRAPRAADDIGEGRRQRPPLFLGSEHLAQDDERPASADRAWDRRPSRANGQLARADRRSGQIAAHCQPVPIKEGLMESVLLDLAGHRRSPATMPGCHRGRPPGNKGRALPGRPTDGRRDRRVMRSVGDRSDGRRLRALIVLLWRAGLRISEALALQESDPDPAAARCSSGVGRAANAARPEWTAGHGSSLTHGSRSADSSLSERCCASSTVRPPVAGGKRRPRASSYTTRPPERAPGVGSHRISCGMLMRPRWRTKAFRSW
jgi:hypothetical protein